MSNAVAALAAYIKNAALHPDLPLDQWPVTKANASFVSAKALQVPGNGILSDGRDTEFLQVISRFSAFAAAADAGLFPRYPLGSRVARFGTIEINAAGELAEKVEADPILAQARLAPLKSAAITILSDDMLRALGAAGEANLVSALGTSLGPAMDKSLVAAITTPASPTFTATPATAAASMADAVAALFTATGQNFAWLASPTAIARLMEQDRDDIAVSPTGGEAMGIQLWPTDGLAAGQLALVRTSDVPIAVNDFSIRAAQHATVGGMNVWQVNARALASEVLVSAAPLADPVLAVVEITA